MLYCCLVGFTLRPALLSLYPCRLQPPQSHTGCDSSSYLCVVNSYKELGRNKEQEGQWW